jgi:hypothetical protein
MLFFDEEKLTPMHVPLSPETHKRLTEAASRRGVAPSDLARELIETHLPPAEGANPNQATLALLDEWERQARTTDPAELARIQEEGEELMEALARNRLEMEGPHPRKLWP